MSRQHIRKLLTAEYRHCIDNIGIPSDQMVLCKCNTNLSLFMILIAGWQDLRDASQKKNNGLSENGPSMGGEGSIISLQKKIKVVGNLQAKEGGSGLNSNAEREKSQNFMSFLESCIFLC